MHAVSHDPTLAHLVTLRDGRRLTAVQMQLEFLEQARKYVEDRLGSDVDAQTADVLDRWESVLDPARGRPDVPGRRARLGRQAGGAARATATATASTGTTPRLHLVDLQYSDVRPDKGLAQRLQARGRLVRLTTDAEVERGRRPRHRTTPVRGSAASACAATPTRSPRRRGTR